MKTQSAWWSDGKAVLLTALIVQFVSIKLHLLIHVIPNQNKSSVLHEYACRKRKKKYGMVLGVRPQKPSPRVRDTVTRQILACLNTPSVQKRCSAVHLHRSCLKWNFFYRTYNNIHALLINSKSIVFYTLY